MNEVTNKWMIAKRWWAHQGEVPGRQKRCIVAASSLVILLFFGLLPEPLKNLLISAGVVVGSIVGYRFAMKRRQAKGNDAPIGEWAKFGLILGAGAIAMLLVIPGAFVGFMGLGAGGNLGTTLLIGFLMVVVEILTFLAMLVLAGVQFQRARSGSSKASAALVESVWAGADSKSLEIVEVLNSPRLLNPRLYEAGLSISEKPVGLAPAKRGPESGFQHLMTRVSARTRSGVFTVNGSQLTLPRLVRIERSMVGPVAFFTTIPGATENTFDWAADRLEVSLRVPEIRVEQLPEDRAHGLFRMTFVLLNPLKKLIPYDWDAPVSYKAIPFGLNESGQPVSLGLLEMNLLLGGLPGGGKSGGITTFLAGISRLPNVAIIGLDPKSVEQMMWKPRFSAIAGPDRDAEDGHHRATELLEKLMQELGRRYDWLVERGLKKVVPEHFESLPLIVVVADELADLVAIGSTKEEKQGEARREQLFRRLVALGRAAGIIVVTATQKPQSDVIPTSLRDLIQQRVAYATMTPAMTDTILSTGAAANGALAHDIAGDERGVCYIINESSRTAFKAKTYWVPDEEVDSIARRTAHLRVELPWLGE